MTARNPAPLLVADLGASSLRLAMIDADGNTLAADARNLATHADGPRREQDARTWWQGFSQMAPSLLDLAGRPSAIVLTGGTRTQVLVDDRGEPLSPAIMWDDHRATDQANRLSGELHRQGNPLNAFHPAARLAWLARHQGAEVAAAEAVLQPKDFLLRRLAGTACGDTVSNWMLMDGDRYDDELIAATGFPATKLPALHEPAASVGVVAGDVADHRLAGVPLLCGAMDTWCCALALGTWQADAVYNLSGTSEVVGVTRDHVVYHDGVLTVPWGNGLWHLGGPSQCGGTTLRWAQSVLGLPDESLDTLLAGCHVDADTPLFLPYLDGERTPWWDTSLTGAWQGLRSQHRAGDLLLAVVEGIAQHGHAILEAAGEALPATDPSPVMLGGGLARSDRWCQLRADVLGRPVVRGADEPGLAGAAMLAMTALGWCPSMAAAQARIGGHGQRFEPAADGALVAARHARFREHALGARNA